MDEEEKYTDAKQLNLIGELFIERFGNYLEQKGGNNMFITVKEWRALSLRNRMLLLEAAANKSKH